MPVESFIRPTREPARSETLTPTARNNASISAHLMSAGVGVAKMRRRVRVCLVLSLIGLYYHLFASASYIYVRLMP